ncbi:hypothetical protein MLD52_10795 [Puniceicoccaceae bacterium K14]|nr:hypothetical protein [Puniceicoccaceae bacterium K14]
MNATLNRICTAVSLFFIGSCIVVAESIEVRELEYSLIKYESSDEWYELSIELEAFRDSQDEERRDPSFIDNIRVEVFVATEIRATGRKKPFEFYRSGVELVSIEQGRTFVRFYLPPEIVKRDRVRGEPHSFIVRVYRGEELLNQSLSRSLNRESVLANFEKRLAENIAANDGILLPQKGTPFFNEYSGASTTGKGAPFSN